MKPVSTQQHISSRTKSKCMSPLAKGRHLTKPQYYILAKTVMLSWFNPTGS